LGNLTSIVSPSTTRVTSTVHSEPVEGPEPVSVLEGVGVAIGVSVGVGIGESVAGDCVAIAVAVRVRVAVSGGLLVTVGERTVVSPVDVAVVEREREEVVSASVGLVVVAPSTGSEVVVVPSVPADPLQPPSSTMRTRASAESERRIRSDVTAI
jgi:hypothetical protein